MPSARRWTQLLLLALAISACRHQGTAIPPDDFLVALAPLPTADDSTFDPQTLRGKPTLVLFASPTCGHCMIELPIAEQAATAEKANIVAVFVVGAKKHAASVTKSKGFKAPVLVDDGTLRKRYDIKGVPYTVILDANGRAVEAFKGEQDEETLRDALDAAR